MSVRGRRGLLGLLAGGALALLAGRWLAGQYADWAFYDALDASSIWRSRTTHLLFLAGSAFVGVTAFAFANLFAVRQSIVSLVLPRQVGDLEFVEAVPTQRLTLLAAVLAILVGAFFALLPHDWSAAALAWEGIAFGELEPYIERDLAFYVAWLPWERAVQERTTAMVVVTGVLVVIAYGLTPSLRWGPSGLYVSTWVRRHLSVLGGLLVLLIGWDWRLDRYERLSAGSGIWGSGDSIAHFSAFDHRIALPYLAVASFATVPIAAVLAWAGWSGYRRFVVAMLSALVLGGPVASAVLPLVARRPLSTPEARGRERSYLATSALYTRRAYGVDEIAGADTAALAVVRTADLPRAVSIWDPAALAGVAVADARRGDPAGLAWRAGSAGLEAVQLRSPAGGTASFRWYGEASAAWRADETGRPFAAPGIADGRIDGVIVHPNTGPIALVADTTGRIAAPEFRGTLARTALAWDLQDPRLLFRELPEPTARLVTAREVRARVQRLVPFLTVGSTVTPLVRGDSLHWVVELFVTAAAYPLSEALNFEGRSVHYVRHAATAFVQAQTGRVMLVPSERPDPVMQFWLRQFAAAFTPLAAAPEWVRAERPPAVDQMAVQGAALARVGFQGDTLGRRNLARPDDADADLATGPATFVQADAGGTMLWGLPVDLPAAGVTLGVLVARGGADRRTEFHHAPGPRWTSVLESLQSAADSAGFGRTLPDARRGRVQAVPTEGGTAWVQSYYAWPADGPPRLAGVVVRRGESLTTGRTLAEALGVRLPVSAVPNDAFRERVARLYGAMQAALRAGDWRAYGDAWAALGRLLEQP
jgi:uncharacterized protein